MPPSVSMVHFRRTVPLRCPLGKADSRSDVLSSKFVGGIPLSASDSKRSFRDHVIGVLNSRHTRRQFPSTYPRLLTMRSTLAWLSGKLFEGKDCARYCTLLTLIHDHLVELGNRESKLMISTVLVPFVCMALCSTDKLMEETRMRVAMHIT